MMFQTIYNFFAGLYHRIASWIQQWHSNSSARHQASACASGEGSPKTSPASFDGPYDKQPGESIINPHSNSSLPGVISETSKRVKPALPEAH